MKASRHGVARVAGRTITQAFFAIFALLGVTFQARAGTYADWQASQVFNSPADADPLSAPAGDGIPNLDRYAFGLSPGSRAGLPTAVLTGSGVVISWQQDNTATDLAYLLQYSTDLVHWLTPNNPNYVLTGSTGGITRLAVLDTPPASPPRYYQVRVFLTGSAGEAPATGLSATVLPAGILLNWSDNSATETQYLIQRLVNGVPESAPIRLAPDTISYTDTNLIPGSVYTYQVTTGGSAPPAVVSATASPLGTASSLAGDILQLVTSQLAAATNSGTGTLIWASQPGMIRQYGVGGSLKAAYKLYSSPSMVILGGTWNGDPSGDVESTWDGNPALFVDLNAPVVSSTSVLFPIVDPGAAAPMPTATGTASLVDGFSISPSVGTVFPSSPGDPARRLPMPVRWLYILRSGAVATPAATSGTTLDFSGLPISQKPTAANPIVGRIAFWTDDESSKLNVNTATEGSYWDIPSFSTSEDVAFASHQPASLEFNRQPGHPASTSLSPVLWSYLGLPHPAASMQALPSTTAGYDADQDVAPALSLASGSYFPTIFSFTPGGVWGGSLGGTRITLSGSNGISLLNSILPYSIFDQFALGTYAANAALSPAAMEKLRFFLTTESRSSELNPFGKPKISIWPVFDINYQNPANPSQVRSPLDATMAAASTLNGQPYYFARHDPTTPTGDVTPRNQLLYSYVRNLLDQPAPGWAGSFTSGKWTAVQADQILTNVFDYIRSCVNTADTSAASSTSANYQYSYTTPPVVSNGYPTFNPGGGQVTPMTLNNPDGRVTRGIGRFPTLRGATLQFIARAANQPPLLCGSNNRPLLYDANGNLISASDGTFPSSLYPAILTGQVYAKVNPMHPYTCPQPGLALNGTYGYVPQLISNGYPVIANTNATNINTFFPIFQLNGTAPLNNSNTPGTPPTRTYPALDPSNSLAATSGFGSPQSIFYSGTSYLWTQATNDVILASGGYRNHSSSWNSPSTHAGLEFLPVQRANRNLGYGTLLGAFDIPNPRYTDRTVLAAHQTRIEVIWMADPVDVAQGHAGMWYNFNINVTGLDSLCANGIPFGFVHQTTQLVSDTHYSPWMMQSLYGLGWEATAAGRYGTPGTSGTNGNTLPFFGGPTVITTGSNFGQTFAFTGAHPLNVQLLTTAGLPVQTIKMDFPDGTFPTPKLTAWWNAGIFDNYPPVNAGDSINSDLVNPTMCSFVYQSAYGAARLVNNHDGFRTSYMFIPSEMNCSESNSNDPSYIWGLAGLNRDTCDTFRSVEMEYGDTRLASSLINVPQSFFTPNPYYFYSSQYLVANWPTYMRAAYSMRVNDSTNTGALVGSLVNTSTTGIGGNLLNYSQAFTIGGISGIPAPSGTAGAQNIVDIPMSRGVNAYNGTGGHTEFPYTTPSVDFNDPGFLSIWNASGDYDNGLAVCSDGPFINKADDGMSGPGNVPFITQAYYSAADSPAGASLLSAWREMPSAVMFGSLPAFDSSFDPTTPSLSNLNASWRTLLFCPNPNSPDSPTRDVRVQSAGQSPESLIASGSVPDHLLLDFFHMPVVEPQIMTDPVSSAGKVNLNCQIAPFTYIRRDSALRGLLKSTLITAVDEQFIGDYKLRGNSDNSVVYSDASNPSTITGGYNAFGAASNLLYFRYPVHLDETLYQLEQRFASGDLYRSPSEICALWLYPARQPSLATPEDQATLLPALGLSGHDDATHDAIKAWWYSGPGVTRKGLTGDNLRERPYAGLYPRVTTQSNTYTIHYRAQVLQKAPGSDPARWVEGQDMPIYETRGSKLIERSIDVTNPNLPDPAATPNATLDSYYQYNVLNSRTFPY